MMTTAISKQDNDNHKNYEPEEYYDNYNTITLSVPLMTTLIVILFFCCCFFLFLFSFLHQHFPILDITHCPVILVVVITATTLDLVKRIKDLISIPFATMDLLCKQH